MGHSLTFIMGTRSKRKLYSYGLNWWTYGHLLLYMVLLD
jgi:hypothetical protein